LTVEDPDKKPPISIKFEIPYFTISGIQVRYLKVVDKSGYQAFPWVRYITQNGGIYVLIRLFLASSASISRIEQARRNLNITVTVFYENDSLSSLPLTCSMDRFLICIMRVVVETMASDP
jgi:hypothetical protein